MGNSSSQKARSVSVEEGHSNFLIQQLINYNLTFFISSDW